MRAPLQPRHYWYSQLTSVKLIKPVLCACARWMKTACFLYTRNTNREPRYIQASYFWLLLFNEIKMFLPLIILYNELGYKQME